VLNALQKRLIELHGSGHSEVLMYGLRDMVVQGVRATLWILSAIVGFILLIVCANVANLCLAKASSRDREVGVRRALGASKLRLLRQFTTESVVLSLAGGVTGVVLTVWTVFLFRIKIADFVPMADAIGVRPQEFLFGLGLSLLVGIFLGIAPFWFMQRPGLVNILTERRSILGHHARFSNMLISGQIAVALILSIGMGLMIRSMVRASSADAGFNREDLVTFTIGMGKKDEAQRSESRREFLERLSALPYVKTVSTDSWAPCHAGGPTSIVTVEGYASPDDKPIQAIFHDVSEDYFRTLQIPIRKGRGISPQEHQQKERVVVINESLAKLIWADGDPIGKELTFCEKPYRIVGVAADMIQGNVKWDKPNHLFFPFDTHYALLTMFLGPDLRVVVRTDSGPGAVIPQARAMLRDIDATQPLYDVSTFRAQMNKCVSQERFTTTFLTVFASIALLLIVIGIYGVVSYAVAQRTREIGIRMALGAEKTSILAMVLKQGFVLSIVGLVVGVAGAIGLTRFLSSYLYEVSATDPVTFVFVPALITGVSMLACYVPARRAARIDPMEALRYE
jgi:predicted permease